TYPEHMVMYITDKPKCKYIEDPESIIKVINKIGVENFIDKFGSYQDAMESLINATNKYIHNKEQTKLNAKRKRTKKRGKRLTKKQEQETNELENEEQEKQEGQEEQEKHEEKQKTMKKRSTMKIQKHLI